MMDEPEHRAASAPPLSERAALIAALEWQIEAGADEAIGETPLDRTGEAGAQAEAAGARAFEPTRAPAKGAPSGKRSGAQSGAPDRGGGVRTAAKPQSEAASAAARAEEIAADARRVAAAAADLPALAAALAAFEGSGLRAGAKNCVFADGRPGAPLMVIGEGPGAEEDRLGKPFVGRSGQLLDRMLAAIGLSRAAEEIERAVYIANLVPWRPLGNRAPDEQEVAALAPFLDRQIALAAPRLLLCLGGAPAKHVMGARAGVTRFRGSWTTYARGGVEIPCLATFHPAYLLRSPEMKRLAWRDLLALRAKMDAILGS